MEKTLTGKLVWYIKNFPEVVAYVGVVALISDDFVSMFLRHEPFFGNEKRLSLVAAALASLALSFNLHRRRVSQALDAARKEHLGVEELIPSSTALDLKHIFRDARVVRILTLAGTKIARLGEDTIIRELRSSKIQKKVMILLADPYSSAIRARYESDEPPQFETGLEGLERRLRTLHSLRQSMTASERKRFQVRIFTCYPTCSIVQCDTDIYSATYGFRMRGTDCPKIHAKVGGRYADFLLAHFEKVYEKSQSLDDWIAAHPLERLQ